MDTQTMTLVKRPQIGNLNKLFVYGIFLGKEMRDTYGMSDGRYAVVRDWATVGIGGYIVAAVPAEGYDLTGLLVEVNPIYWRDIDRLEGSYNRVKVKTSQGEAWMYASPERA